MRSLHAVVLAVILCLPLAGTAQRPDQSYDALVANGDPNSQAIAKHRLTAQNLRQMFAVDRELFPLLEGHSDVEKRSEEAARVIDPQRRLGTVEVQAKVYESIPETAEILRRHRITGREYVLTHLVAMVTAMMDDTLAYEALQRQGSSNVEDPLVSPALKFWRSMDAALKAEATEWKRQRGYDKGINR